MIEYSKSKVCQVIQPQNLPFKSAFWNHSGTKYLRLGSMATDSELDICMQEAYWVVDLRMTLLRKWVKQNEQRGKFKRDLVATESLAHSVGIWNCTGPSEFSWIGAKGMKCEHPYKMVFRCRLFMTREHNFGWENNLQSKAIPKMELHCELSGPITFYS